MSSSESSDGGSLFGRIYQLDGEIPQYEVIEVKIKKVQKKIAKYTKKLEKYLDLLAELTAAKEIVAEAALEKAKEALPGKPVETPAAEPALVEATPEEQPKSTSVPPRSYP